jgi:hypothetical protein
MRPNVLFKSPVTGKELAIYTGLNSSVAIVAVSALKSELFGPEWQGTPLVEKKHVLGYLSTEQVDGELVYAVGEGCYMVKGFPRGPLVQQTSAMVGSAGAWTTNKSGSAYCVHDGPLASGLRGERKAQPAISMISRDGPARASMGGPVRLQHPAMSARQPNGRAPSNRPRGVARAGQFAEGSSGRPARAEPGFSLKVNTGEAEAVRQSRAGRMNLRRQGCHQAGKSRFGQVTMKAYGKRGDVTLDEIRCSSARRVRKPRLAFQQT